MKNEGDNHDPADCGAISGDSGKALFELVLSDDY